MFQAINNRSNAIKFGIVDYDDLIVEFFSKEELIQILNRGTEIKNLSIEDSNLRQINKPLESYKDSFSSPIFDFKIFNKSKLLILGENKLIKVSFDDNILRINGREIRKVNFLFEDIVFRWAYLVKETPTEAEHYVFDFDLFVIKYYFSCGKRSCLVFNGDKWGGTFSFMTQREFLLTK